MELHDFPLLAAVLAVATVIGLIATRLRQPLIVAFIGVGILVGPAALGWVEADGTIELLAHLGIAVLLFLVGLRLDLHLVRTTGPIALATGLGQVVFTSAIGYLIARLLGMDNVTSLYVAVALTFSSTIIIVKLLSDKRELEQLHGRIAVGFLIVQDIVVVMVMIALTAFGQRNAIGGAENDLSTEVLLVLGKGIGLLAAIALLMKFVLPRLLDHIARSQELLVLFGVAYAISIAAISEWLGFSTEVGAFLAGVSLATTPYRDALGARLVSLRDFMLLFFFLQLGAGLEFTDAGRQLGEAAVLSLFVLIGNPLIVIVIMALMRYPVRVGFLCGLTVAQISEFSLILAALGLSLGHITGATVSLITVVGLITIGVSTYLIMYSQQIWGRIGGWLERFQRVGVRQPDTDRSGDDVDVILYGLGRFGGHAADRLARAGLRVLAVDWDPYRVTHNEREGVTAVFGSAEDVHFLETLPLSRARWVISAIPHPNTNLALVDGLRRHGYEGRIMLTAHTPREVERSRAAGVDIVLDPFSEAADTALDIVSERARGEGGRSDAGVLVADPGPTAPHDGTPHDGPLSGPPDDAGGTRRAEGPPER
ncbi:sodium:proton exchanger [Streptomyces alkaliphilus]|uniref:Sodium:proton exchanger n=2 Tax=Streptomyces alkaliphilus TaxID=1472722 RepID=A0A7W3TGC5_9ACTN|nr:sodium:proton exchanger [Streptomyces alkaliphilus]